MFFSCQSTHRKRGDNLTPRGQICRTKPITPKAQRASTSSAASNLNLVSKEIVFTKMRTCLRRVSWKISPGQSLFTSDSHHHLRANRGPEVPGLNLRSSRVMHSMGANTSGWPWFILMDVQPLLGTKKRAWDGFHVLQDEVFSPDRRLKVD